VKTWLKEEIWTEMSEAPVGVLDRTTSRSSAVAAALACARTHVRSSAS
jgi:hypothetical protein